MFHRSTKQTWVGVIVTCTMGPVSGQTFDSGSDGSFGDIFVKSGNTNFIDLPPDGVIHALTVTVESSGTLRFRKNALNTPVFLLATGEVAIHGTINLDGTNGTTTPPYRGEGGPGGYDGGLPRLGGEEFEPGAGLGPGGALGSAAHAAVPGGENPGTPYGSPLLIPLLGGSGGGGGTVNVVGGGGGGGAILIASNRQIVLTGTITASGGIGSGDAGEGSGGAIRVVAPVGTGNGRLTTFGGATNGHGRIRIDMIDRTEIRWTFTGSVSQGRYMRVFPDVQPRLAIVNVAGRDIPEGSTDPVEILLPFDGSPFQTVTVRARDFTGIVPIQVVLTPNNGDRIVIESQIDMSLGNPSAQVVDVEIPLNDPTLVHAWTYTP